MMSMSAGSPHSEAPGGSSVTQIMREAGYELKRGLNQGTLDLPVSPCTSPASYQYYDISLSLHLSAWRWWIDIIYIYLRWTEHPA